MDISIYFNTLDVDWFSFDEDRPRLGDVAQKNLKDTGFPDIADLDIAIIGVPEERGCISNAGCHEAPDTIRKFLYRLFPGDYKARIGDLGNLISGDTLQDTYFALSAVVSTLIDHRVIPIILGGSQDLTYANYRAYETNGQIINIAAVDAKFDLGNTHQDINAQSYLSKIILHQPNYLFNYTNIGYQSYFVDLEAVELMNNLYFDIFRLGDVRENLRLAEPLMRNADMLSFDISAIRQPDAPGNNNASPNGFYGEEACQLAWYAGISEKITSAGFYEYNPTLDVNGQTAHLIAQMIWYFIEGAYHRRNEFPQESNNDFIKYRVQLDDFTDDLLFYKSKQSDRWWMQVMNPENIQLKYERHYVVPCTFDDYKKATSDELPDRWWQAYKKLM
ncbi:MAG: formimidoylglutamase [Bacteroidales bacterium]|nr:formimidoylglutamase [Bacteroidales bacterium]